MTYHDSSQQWHAGQQHLPVSATNAVPAYYPTPVAVVPQKSAGAAVALELVLGLFGVGNIYAGRVATGVILMVSFWALFWVNFLLIFVMVGFATMPLTWITYLVVGALLAARSVEQHNSGAVGVTRSATRHPY
ncbi:NINE protein [Micromonospora endolithica]|uniref:NINE protein n=1 Tax=Micromonospora endolithica TaxID=230091 RepID=A0A3A9ZJX4_9ACTN|nr:NINE protein [Micromonospora endolithica]RKN47717.1 NINE protein [Micromonospora endolithica]TWJ21389.1 TM2 domain-containing protein [Micromonospora endolithica]